MSVGCNGTQQSRRWGKQRSGRRARESTGGAGSDKSRGKQRAEAGKWKRGAGQERLEQGQRRREAPRFNFLALLPCFPSFHFNLSLLQIDAISNFRVWTSTTRCKSRSFLAVFGPSKTSFAALDSISDHIIVDSMYTYYAPALNPEDSRALWAKPHRARHYVCWCFPM